MNTHVGVILVAAGSGTRLRAAQPKAFVRVAGHTLLEHAVARAFEAADTTQIVVVAPASHLVEAGALASAHPRAADVTVVAGGAERTHSVAAGLAALHDDIGVVLVHDAARCLAPAGLFDRLVEAVRTGHDAVVPGLAVADTIKQVDASGQVVATPDRSTLRAIQTPQAFTRHVLADAHASGVEATDDAALVERLGTTVLVVDGDELAFKVTTPTDLERAERILGG
ncbi:2-C-methyl-D-erythritol 4-phosphate cytidylyltransferase [Knoellia subterranea]|uniref:2-C-methyl-D-erythritol 4-phosphate cytidylyltransferase n=1 Tax=Knoellia subterranea KCTC 19937 TaxID=1385521 RepID=A0A0A0JKM5_9MICO|nr:2-C-methyl-D-erythritol 4-phosphate cytidylyltransferase [Knoellia subterranea]KGN36597.1 2-C-methyl-D-erythritol 4-phosphate cytidylyltransferase [Knoellia subterranea KCTC 19937]